MRRPTRTVRVGDLPIGGSHPITIQSMTIADTTSVDAVVEEIRGLADAGCPLVRVTVPHARAAEALPAIRARMRERGVAVPLVADIHFTPDAAILAAAHVEKVRINPGNYADRKRFSVREYTDEEYGDELRRIRDRFVPLVREAKARGIALRIGANHGSLSDRILNRYGDTPEGMVESALEFVRICESEGFHDLILSMKSSIPGVMVAANRFLCRRMAEEGMDYPLHIGVTEAGAGIEGRIKSAVGIGTLLLDGIGDTIRVSLTEDSVHEIEACRTLLRSVEAHGTVARGAAGSFEVPEGPGSRRATRSLPLGPVLCGGAAPQRVEARIHPAPWEDLEGSCVQALRALRPSDPAAPRAVAEILALAVPPSFGGARPGETLEAWCARVSPHERGAAVLCEWDLRAPGAMHAIEPLLPWVDVIGARLPEHWISSGEKVAALARIAIRGKKAVRFRIEAPEDADPVAWPLQAAAAADRITRICDEEGLADCGFLVAGRPLVASARAVARGAGIAPIFLELPAEPIEAAVSGGSLLIDGIGDGLCVPSKDAMRMALPEGPAEIDAVGLCYGILQACRLRLTRAEFIACPSCGRTQFDLQTTTRRIQQRTAHLSGVKIAVMGCIVNGPGEMADADFGYVGSAPGKIDLYVGKDRVRQAIPEGEAVERLVDLIRDHGRWTEPPAEV